MTGDIPKCMLWYGVDEPLPEQTQLHAGPLSLVYTAGDLRSIQLGDQVILDRIYVAMRDPNRSSVPAKISGLRMYVEDNAFKITYTARHSQGPTDFVWSGVMSGDAYGTIVFEMDGVA